MAKPKQQQQAAQQQAKQQQQQAQQAQALLLRELSAAEVVARAVFLRRKRAERGKTSRRVMIHLPPQLIPPPPGTYPTVWGDVRIKSIFSHEEGRWKVEVRLPNDEGFSLKDHIQHPPQKIQSSQPSQPSPSQSDDYLDITLTEEEVKWTERFIEQLKAQLE